MRQALLLLPLRLPVSSSPRAGERPSPSDADMHVVMVGRAVRTTGFLTGDTAFRVVHHHIRDIDNTVTNTFGGDVDGACRTCGSRIMRGLMWAFQDRVQIQACG